MDLQQWKTEAGQNLDKLARQLRLWTPGTLYSALSAMTVLPVIHAANQGDFAAIVMVGSGIGRDNYREGEKAGR